VECQIGERLHRFDSVSIVFDQALEFFGDPRTKLQNALNPLAIFRKSLGVCQQCLPHVPGNGDQLPNVGN
jgi:hypothetical protein